MRSAADGRSQREMISVSFEINGRKVNPNQAGKAMKDAIESTVIAQIQTTIQKKLGSLRCAEHGQSPKVVFKGRSFDRLESHISGCCEAVIEEARRRLS